MDAPTPLEDTAAGAPWSFRARLVSTFTVAMLVVLAGAGAATSPHGVLLGVPSVATLGLALGGGALVWRSRFGGLAGFLIPATAVFVAAMTPAFSSLLLFSGAPLFVFALAGVILALAFWRIQPPRVLLFPALFGVYAFVAYQAQTRIGPDGDEPQYLMVAQSLIQDHDLALDQDFAEKRYEAFFSRPLDPHFRIRGPEGQIYSLHAVGLSLLILPAYALMGYPGASFFMAFLAALLVREVRRLLIDLTGDGRLAGKTAWLIGLSPPIIHFAGLIFTEIPAALLLCVGLRAGVFGKTPRSALLAASCAAALPWLNVRYAILSLAIVGALLWRMRGELRLAARPFSILVGSALAIVLYHFELWGFFDPRRVYGKSREFSLDILPEGLPGLFFDQEFGLFVYAPIFVLSLSGFVLLWRRQRALAIAGLAATLGVVATAGVWPMWRGGFNPPARFLVPLVSILACALALSLKRGLRPATALLAGWSLWCGIGGALNMETIHRDRNGVAPFFRTQSGAREWTAVLPSFVLSEDRPTRVLIWPWVALLCVPAALSVRRRSGARTVRNRDTLFATVAFMTIAIVTDEISPRLRSPERDASRLVGRTSIAIPSLDVQTATTAVWPIDLFYEPHRSPQGVPLMRALSLEHGAYTLALTTDAGEVGVPPTLAWARRSGGAATRITGTPTSDGMSVTFSVASTGEYDFVLFGGAPLSLKQASLSRVR